MFFLICLVGICYAGDASAATPSPDAPLVDRVWTDRTGTRHATAKLVEVLGDRIRLLKPSGASKTILLATLSEADQEFVKATFAQRASTTSAPQHTPRIWTDRDGVRRTAATLVELRGEKVLFRRPSGKFVLTSLESLHPIDQQLVKTLVRQSLVGSKLGQPLAAETAVVESSAIDRAALPLATGLAVVKALRPLAPGGELAAQSPGFQGGARATAELPPQVVYIRVSRPYLEQYVALSFKEVESVQDVVVGTPIRGTSHTTGRTAIAFVPSQQGAVTDFFVVGKSEADTVGYHWPVQVYSHATTHFQARKRIVIGDNGAAAQGSVTTAQCQTTTTGISSMLPGLRGRLSQRIAGRVVERTRPQANAETARHVEQMVCRNLDQNVGSSLTRLNDVNRLLVAARQAGLDLHVTCRTTTDQLHVVLCQGPASGLELDFDPPAIAGEPHLAIWVHGDLAQRVLADAGLYQVLQPLLNAIVSQPVLSPVGATAATRPQYKFGRSDDGRWLTVGMTVPKLASDRSQRVLTAVANQQALVKSVAATQHPLPAANSVAPAQPGTSPKIAAFAIEP